MDKPIRHREPARGKLAGKAISYNSWGSSCLPFVSAAAQGRLAFATGIRADAKAAKVVKETGSNAPGTTAVATGHRQATLTCEPFNLLGNMAYFYAQVTILKVWEPHGATTF